MIVSKLPKNPPSIFATMSALAHQYNALNLSQGFPSFPVNEKLLELAQQAIADGYNQYAPMRGVESLRLAIAEMMQQQHQYAYNPETEICITAGATQGIFTAIQACIHKGDEVIILTPAYDCYEPAIQLAGGKAVKVPMILPDFKPDWQGIKDNIAPSTKMIMVNTPHNPSGYVFTNDDMMQLQEIAVNHNLLVISDEVYEHMVFDEHEHLSVARYEGLRERCFITGSFGKTFHVTGWKTGYCLAFKQLMDEFLKVHQHVIFCTNHSMQIAISQYLSDKSTYLKLPLFYQRKRDLFLSLITNPALKIAPTQGSYFQLIDYSEISDEGDVAFANALIIKNKLASIPISVFMDDKNHKMLRFCFAKTDEELVQAAAILNSLR